jgi:hypothetical protein
MPLPTIPKDSTPKLRYTILARHKDDILQVLKTTDRRQVANQLGIHYAIFTTWVNSVTPLTSELTGDAKSIIEAYITIQDPSHTPTPSKVTK